jgi:hypothetical protein
MFRVSCEFYDKAWYTRANNKEDAIMFVKDMTEELGWHKSYPDEKRDWDVEEFSISEGECIESQDM